MRIRSLVLTGTLAALVAGGALSWQAHAETAGKSAPAGTFAGLAQELWPQAQRSGISRATFEAAFRGLTPDPEVIEQANYQPEFETAIWDYLEGRVSPARIANGLAMKALHDRDLAAIEARFGVDRHILLAIWGIESKYGEYTGEHDVVRSLATLAADDWRADFWKTQLIAALAILENGDIARDRFQGSWAGAMGHTQFMPTTFNEKAVDWTGDGRRDVWDSPADALASAANYLAKAGWKSGLPWGFEVRLPQGFDYTLVGEAGERSIGAWKELGVVPEGGRVVAAEAMARLMLPAGSNGPAVLVTNNFRAILAYNNSAAYGLAIGTLADRIAGSPPFVASWPKHERTLTKAERFELQELLSKRGFYSGEIIGIIGPKTAAALKAFQVSSGLIPDAYASPAVLEHLRKTD